MMAEAANFDDDDELFPMPVRKRDKAFSPGGQTPTSKSPSVKRKKKAGRACKQLQATLQNEIRAAFQLDYGRCLTRSEVMGEVSNEYKNKEVECAVKEVFGSAITIRNNIFHHIAVKHETMATPLSDITNKSATTTTATVALSQEQALKIVLNKISEEVCGIVKKSPPSLLRTDDLKQLTLESLQTELKSRVPTLYKVVETAIMCNNHSKAKIPGVSLAVCSILFTRSEQLNAVAKVTTLRLKLKGVPTKTINHLNHLHMCVSYQTASSLMDKYAAELEERVKSWDRCFITQAGDNVDIRSKRRHESSAGSSLDMHFYNNIITKPRVDLGKYLDEKPTPPSEWTISEMEKVVPSKDEMTRWKSQIKSLVAEVWTTQESQFGQSVCSPTHTFSSDMKTVSEVVQIGVLEKNETVATDMIDIMVYCSNYPTKDYDGMIFYHGDYATYERAKSAISCMTTAKELAISKFIPAISDFHLQIAWTQLILKQLMSEDSIRDVGSLFQLKVLIGAKQVKQKDTANSFYATEQFLDKVRDALLGVAHEHYRAEHECPDAALEAFLSDLLWQQLPPLPGTCCSGCGKHYRDAVRLLKHRNTCCMIPQESRTNSPDDEVKAYTMYLLKLILIRDNLAKAIKYGDGERLVMTVKFMLPYFRINGNTKYALASLELIAMPQFFLSDRQRIHLLQGRFINQKGRADSNYPIDLACEHKNCNFKDNFALYQGQLSQKTLDRISKSQDETTAILDNFQAEFDKPRFIGKHKRNEQKFANDVRLIVNTVRSKNLFSTSTRHLESKYLHKACGDKLAVIDIATFQNWITNRLQIMNTYSFLK